ncbi:PREDICTED: putative uncharacterized protein C16orf96 homolog [Elephantulus edwardii]|uniref:putative uncharacterized protein C16orf96 homolog n=1 Tax=Elephantulus edwardii TaxID=28737 RepID=UPI0003F0A950|nr:PREDICTED: putative uncharacterized protein C16orf96 homolog [Elephantulus edwardii]
MSFSLTFRELVNIAIPTQGVVNFQALHMLLHGILEHINMTDLKKVFSGKEEEDFLQAPLGMFTLPEGVAQPTPTPNNRIHDMFDHMVSRIDKMESQLADLSDISATLQLSEISQGNRKPVQDVWTLIKLRKMVEANEEATSKVMHILQELLSDLTSVKVTTNTLKEEVGKLKDQIEKINLDKFEAFFEDVKRQNRKLTAVQRELTTLQNKLSTFPKVEDLVLWSSLHEAIFSGGMPRRPVLKPDLQPDLLLEDTRLLPETTMPQSGGYIEAVAGIQSSEPTQGTEPAHTMWDYEFPEIIYEQQFAQTAFRPPPPARKMGSAWPQALQPHKPHHTKVPHLQVVLEKGEELNTSELVVPHEPPPEDGPSREASSKEVPALEVTPLEVASLEVPPLEVPPLEVLPLKVLPLEVLPMEVPLKEAPSKEVPAPEVPLKEIPSKEVPTLEVPNKVPSKEVPHKQVSPKARQSALHRFKTTAAIAAAAAAAYAAAASSAARAAKAAAQVVKDAPATNLANLATTVASSGVLGVLAEDLGAGTARGATNEVIFKEGVDLEDDYAPTPLSSPDASTLAAGTHTSVPASQTMNPEEKKEAVRHSMSYIATLPASHESMKEELARLSTKLQQRLNYLVNIDAKSKFGNTLEILQEKIGSLQKFKMKEEELEQVWGGQIQMLKDHYILLDRTVEKLQIRLDEYKTLQAQIKNLEINKVDKINMEQELKEKADRSILASKASRADLETVVMELNDMMHSLMLKVTNYEEDWKKSFEHLNKDMSKLIHSNLDNLKLEMEDVWKIVRRLLIEGLRFNPDSAAGFRKKLFERVKCISCDRPVEMMTGPHLITIRKAQLLSRLQPSSPNSYEYQQQPQQIREQQNMQLQGLVDPEGNMHSVGFQQEWGDAPRNNSNLKFNPYSLSTIYPYGDPQLLDYDTAEVDILGVDGILYKGRMNNPKEVWPTFPSDKELAAVKVPRPPSQNLYDPAHTTLYSQTSASSTIYSGPLRAAPPRPPSLPPMPPPIPRDAHQAPGAPRHQKTQRFESRTNTLLKEEHLKP